MPGGKWSKATEGKAGLTSSDSAHAERAAYSAAKLKSSDMPPLQNSVLISTLS
jgi:hypothetical protein